MRDELIKAAIRVANRPNDHNITELLRAVFDMPVEDMPKEFDDIPISEYCVPGSTGYWLARYAELKAASQEK